MSTWVAVSRGQHTSKYWKPREAYSFSATEQVAVVHVNELNLLLPHYCIAFIESNRVFVPVVILSLDAVKNLYVDTDGRWLGDYVPASLRAYPFSFAEGADGNKILCVDNTQVSEDSSQRPFFNTDGSLTDDLNELMKFMESNRSAQEITAMACHALTEQNLIEPWLLTVSQGEASEPINLSGLFRINEQALNQLDADKFAELRKYGGLLLAYAQIFSTSQLNQLTQRVRYHENKQEISNKDLTDMAGFFQDSGALSFDNL